MSTEDLLAPLRKHNFTDELGHRLENCVDFHALTARAPLLIVGREEFTSGFTRLAQRLGWLHPGTPTPKRVKEI